MTERQHCYTVWHHRIQYQKLASNWDFTLQRTSEFLRSRWPFSTLRALSTASWSKFITFSSNSSMWMVAKSSRMKLPVVLWSNDDIYGSIYKITTNQCTKWRVFLQPLTNESPLTLTQQMLLIPVEYRSDPSNHSEKEWQKSGQQNVITFYLL